MDFHVMPSVQPGLAFPTFYGHIPTPLLAFQAMHSIEPGLPFPIFHGHIPTPPLPGSPLAYNEDVIVSLLVQILNILISLGHFPADWVDFAPPDTGHQLDEELCAELGLAPTVVSLLKKLPYLDTWSADGVEIRPRTFLINHRDPTQLRLSRGVNALPPGIGAVPWGPALQPQDILLTFQKDYDVGENWVLDTHANTIRRCTSGVDIDRAKKAFPNYRPEFPGELHYRNSVALHAPSFFQGIIDDYIALLYMPGIEVDFLEVHFTEYFPGAAQVRCRLIDEYGWYENFRAEDWWADKERVWEEAGNWAEEHPDREPLMNEALLVWVG